MPAQNERTVKKGGVLKWENARWWHFRLIAYRGEWVRISNNPNGTIRVETREGQHICDAERVIN